MTKNLTPEQIEQLKKEIAKLPPEKIEELKRQQCPFCLIAANKIPSRKLFEDSKVVALLDINPATNGHTLIFTKKHYSSLMNVPNEELVNLILIANTLSSTLVKSLNAEGLNLYVANGEIAGQKVDHVIMHLIPRYKGDNINFEWQPRKASDQGLEITQKKILQSLKITVKVEKPKEKLDLKSIEKYLPSEERTP